MLRPPTNAPPEAERPEQDGGPPYGRGKRWRCFRVRRFEVRCSLLVHPLGCWQPLKPTTASRVRVALCDLDIDDFGVSGIQAAQFIAYSSGLAFAVEPLLPRVIGRPSSIPPGVPAGDPRVGSGSKCDAVRHRALLAVPGVPVTSKHPLTRKSLHRAGRP